MSKKPRVPGWWCGKPGIELTETTARSRLGSSLGPDGVWEYNEAMPLRHLALKTRDLAATKRFYVEVLGLREAFPHPGMLFLETPGGGDLLNFVRVRRRVNPRAGGLDHFGLHVGQKRLAALGRRLKAAGVKVVGRRGRWSVYVKDPNGYTVELYAD